MNTFGDRLREARRARGLTQEELAAQVDVTKSAVSGWENNRETPSFDKLLRISGALNEGLDALMASVGRYHPTPDRTSEGNGINDAGVAQPYHPHLSAEEACLLRVFKALSPKKRRALLALIECDKPTAT